MDLMSTAQLLGNFGEFFGAIAVVITLGYLAVQVRHSKEATEAHTKSLRSAARFEAGKSWWEEALQMALSKDMARIIAVGYEDPGRLDDAELQRFIAWGLQYFLREDMLYHQYLEGVLPEDVWSAHAQVTAANMQDKTMKRLVQDGHFPLSEEFRSYLDSVERTEHSSSWSWPPRTSSDASDSGPSG